MAWSNLENNEYLKKAVSFIKHCGEKIKQSIPTITFKKFHTIVNSKQVKLGLAGLAIVLLMLQTSDCVFGKSNYENYASKTTVSETINLKDTDNTNKLLDNSMLLCLTYNSVEDFCAENNIDCSITTLLENTAIDKFSDYNTLSSTNVSISKSNQEENDTPSPGKFAGTLLEGLESLAESERKKREINDDVALQTATENLFNTQIFPNGDDIDKKTSRTER